MPNPGGLPNLQGGSSSLRPSSASSSSPNLTRASPTPAASHGAPPPEHPLISTPGVIGHSASRPSSASAAAAQGAGNGSSTSNARLLSAMEGLSSGLRGVLSEQALRNVEALKAIRQAADIVLPPPAHPTPTQRAAGVGGSYDPVLQGALHHAGPQQPQQTADAAAAAVAPSAANAATGLTAPRLMVSSLPGHTTPPPTLAAPGGLPRPRSASSAAEASGTQPTPSALPNLTPQLQTSSVPSPNQSRLALGPRWGATEGGRDSLGWVRGLACHSERSPLYQTGVEEMGSLEGAVPEGPRRNVLPSLRTDRREDVGLLSQWLEGMVAQLSSHDAKRVAGLATSIPGPPPPPNALPHPSAAASQQQALFRPATPSTDKRGTRESPGGTPLGRPGSAGREAVPAPQGPSSALELADGVLHVYDVAMEQLKMQVSSECRERGVLMGILWEQVKGVLELRAGLEAESRLGVMQAEYARLMAARDTLSEGIVSLEAHLAEADKEAQAAALQEARSKRSLAGKLAEAQARAEELSGHWRVSDLALNNEVARRLAVDEELEKMRMMLARTEHEWLGYRAQAEELKAGRQQFLDALEEARRDASCAYAARDKARAELEVVLASRAAQDVDMMRMRHEYETDEILVVSLRQQVRDLETQLAQLKTYQREQATKLGAVVADKEALQIERTQLLAGLSGIQAKSSSLESSLNSAETQLAEVKSALTVMTSEHSLLEIESKDAADKARKQIALLEHDVRSLTDRLTDTKYRLNGREISLREYEGELNTVREMLSSVCRAIESQGAEGVPKSDDKGWTVMGPLGAVQRSVVTINRQLHNLWERMEALRRENSVLDQRLEGEVKNQKATQAELYASKAQEANLLRAREVAEMQLDVNNQAKRVMEVEVTRMRTELAQAWNQIGSLKEAEASLSSEVERLKPFEPRCHELESKKENLERMVHVSSQSLEAAQQDIDMLKQHEDFYKAEVDKNVAHIEDLMKQIKESNVAQVENDDLRVEKRYIDKRAEELKAQLETALRAHEATLHQLETAKFFLQGLDLTNPLSEARVQSARHRQAGSRESSRPSSASGGVSEGLAGGGSNVLWRPGTAPAHLTRAISPSRSSRLSSPSPKGRGNAGENVQYLDVSGLDTVEEEGKPAGKGEADLPPAVLEMVRGPAPPITPPSFEAPQTFARPFSPVRHPMSPTRRLPSASLPPRPFSPASRPMSAISSNISIESSVSSVYGDDIPPEIVALLEARRVADQLQTKNAKWTKLKLEVMTAYCTKLKAALVTEVEARTTMEVQLVQQDFMHAQEMVDRERYLSEQLLGSLRGHISRVQHEAAGELSEMRQQLTGVRDDLAHLASTSMAMGVGLKDLQARLTARREISCQTGQSLGTEWAAFIQSFPEQEPAQPMSVGAICEAIVRIYVRSLPSVSSTPVWGDHNRCDTIYDAIMDHYTSRRAPGKFIEQYLQDLEGPVARLMRSVKRHCNNTRIGTFAYLAGLSPDGVVWPPATWHFLLHVLHCLRLLLAGTWHSTVKAWGSSQASIGSGTAGVSNGALVPVQAAYDLVGNLFNVQVPTDLEGSIARRLASIVVPSSTGLGVDMDALLLLLITEYNGGTCPRSALLYPRRLTDGALFNLFNLGGNSKQKDALADGRAASVLRAITSPKPDTTAGMHYANGGFWIRGESQRKDPLAPSVFL